MAGPSSLPAGGVSCSMAHRRSRPLSLVRPADLLGNFVASCFVTASSTLFNTTGIEVAVHHEANLEPRAELTGAAIILTGALGGYPGCIRSPLVLNFSQRRPRTAVRLPARRCRS